MKIITDKREKELNIIALNVYEKFGDSIDNSESCNKAASIFVNALVDLNLSKEGEV